MKVLINDKPGGFGLTNEAIKECIKRGMTCADVPNDLDTHCDRSVDFIRWPESPSMEYSPNDESSIRFRTHPIVLAVVEELGLERAADKYCKLKIVAVPDDLTADDLLIGDGYDGCEYVAEKHRTWS